MTNVLFCLWNWQRLGVQEWIKSPGFVLVSLCLQPSELWLPSRLETLVITNKLLKEASFKGSLKKRFKGIVRACKAVAALRGRHNVGRIGYTLQHFFPVVAIA